MFKQLAVATLPSQKGTVGSHELRDRSKDSEACWLSAQGPSGGLGWCVPSLCLSSALGCPDLNPHTNKWWAAGWV